jgi:hypothetical protein
MIYKHLKPFLFAKLRPSSYSSWAELALFSVSPADGLHNIAYGLDNIANWLDDIADGLHNIADGLHNIPKKDCKLNSIRPATAGLC